LRGCWILPNLFIDEDADDDDSSSHRVGGPSDGSIWATFTPLFAVVRSGTSNAPATPLATPPPDDRLMQFGLINFLILLVIGIVVCWQLGVFEGENVPSFVAKQQDLASLFGGRLLSAPPPPEPANATV